MGLKEILLSLGVFEDNNYLDFYCKLIEDNKETKREKFKTQSHHVIPLSYYKNKYNLLNRKEAEEHSKNDNINFVVNLQYSEHILCHYYLCLFTIDVKLRYGLENAFIKLIRSDANNKINVNDFDTTKLEYYQQIYEEHKILNSELQKGHQTWNKGLTKETNERVLKYSIPRHFSKEHNENNRNSLIRYYQNHEGTMTGKHLTLEQRKKLSESKKGKHVKPKNPEITSKKLSESTKKYWETHPEKRDELIEYNKSRTFSKSTLEKMCLNQPHRLEIHQINLEGEIMCIFKSVNEAIRVTGIKRWRIINSCKTGKIINNSFSFKSDALRNDEKVI